MFLNGELMNKKGFMMAELIVVSSIILVTLVGMYTSYNKIYSIYMNRIGYYDVATLYRIGYYRDVLDTNNKLNEVIEKSKEKVVDISNYIPLAEQIGNTKDTMFMIYNNKKSINSSIFSGKSVNQTYKDYVNYLSNSIDFGGFNYMMVLERCNKLDNGDIDIDNCKYAYLEIFE